MPVASNLSTVRALLNRDRAWAACALGDLAPGYIEHCDWHVSADGSPALVLVYRGFSPPILFAMGEAVHLQPLFAEIDAPEVSLHVRLEALDAMAATYRTTRTVQMRRMVVCSDSFRPAMTGDVCPLGEHDLAAIARLYDEGRQRGDGPTHFHPSMLQQGTFRGVWEGGALVSVAGTHLYSVESGVCAIGNVYTRRDRRGRGLAARVTSAVVAHALVEAVPTIVLNVGIDNARAQGVYQRLGFAGYGEFLEGEARKLTADGTR